MMKSKNLQALNFSGKEELLFVFFETKIKGVVSKAVVSKYWSVAH